MFPGFVGTTECSDFQPSIPRRFVSFTRRYPSVLTGFAPPLAPHVSTARPCVGLFIRFPFRLSRWETTGSPRFLANPLHTCRALRPRRTSGGVAFVQSHGLGSASNQPFEAQSRDPHARCLRFAATVAGEPRKTRFRLSCRLAGRDSTRRVRVFGFSSSLPPHPGLSWRTAFHLCGIASRRRRSGPESSQVPLESVKCGVEGVAPARLGAPAAAAPTKSLGRSRDCGHRRRERGRDERPRRAGTCAGLARPRKRLLQPHRTRSVHSGSTQ